MGSTGAQREEPLNPCFRCGYLIDCHKGVRCSECGFVYRPNDCVVIEKRRALTDAYRHRIRNLILLWIGIWIVYVLAGLGAMWVVDSQMPWVLVYFMVVALSALIWGSIGLGWVASRFAPEHQRRLLWLGWLETLPSVHLSWLSIAGFTAVGSVIAGLLQLTRMVEWGGKEMSWGLLVMTVYVIASFAVWAVGSFVLVLIWPSKLCGFLWEHEIIKCQPGVGILWLLGVVAYLGGCVVGLMGGYLGSALIMILSQ